MGWKRSIEIRHYTINSGDALHPACFVRVWRYEDRDGIYERFYEEHYLSPGFIR
jgi:hypothetical protein